MAAIESTSVGRLDFVGLHAFENLVKFDSIRIMSDELCKCLRRTLVGTPLPLGKRVDDRMNLRLCEYNRLQERNDLTRPKRCDDLCQNFVHMLMIFFTFMGAFDRDHHA